MSLLIPDNNVLLQFVPNVLKSVQGETLLFDKIAQHLEVAEAWLTTTFLSEAVLAELPTRDANNKLLHYLRQTELLGKWGETPSAPHYKRAWRHIFAIELYMLREEGEVPTPSCIEVVNSLRNAPDGIFEEWKQSEIAALFENHGYKNDKRKGGFWF